MVLYKHILKPRKIYFLGVLFFFFLLKGQAESRHDDLHNETEKYYIEYNKEIQNAYFTILDLKYAQAEKELQMLWKKEPYNLALIHLENLMDFFDIFINEDDQAFANGRTRYIQRIKALDKIDLPDPHLKFIKGEIHLQWGILHLKFGNFYRSFSSIKKAYHLFVSNQEEYPTFIANYKSLGILRAALSIVPPEYQWGLRLFTGMEGNLNQGQQEIEYVLNSTSPTNFVFYRETLAMYIMLQLYLQNDHDKAWELIQGIDVDPESQPLTCFAFANLAMRTGNNDLAISYLENRPRGKEYLDFDYLEFMLGEAYLRKLDERAIHHLEYFTQHYQGHNYIKEAYHKIAWYKLIYDDETEYLKAMDNVLSHGTTIIDSDKTANKKARQGVVPNKTLLKAQLLFDGGYYPEAYTLLVKNGSTLYRNEEYRYEYIYRIARVLHEMKKYDEAKGYYTQTYLIGQNRTEYYACNAALQLGIIAEQNDEYSLASDWYHNCLNLSPGSYASGLHRAAKAGLERILLSH